MEIVLASAELKLGTVEIAFAWGYVCETRRSSTPQISISTGEWNPTFLLSPSGNRNPLIEEKQFIFSSLRGKCVTPKERRVACMEDQNNYPLYHRILLSHKCILRGKYADLIKTVYYRHKYSNYVKESNKQPKSVYLAFIFLEHLGLFGCSAKLSTIWGCRL